MLLECLSFQDIFPYATYIPNTDDNMSANPMMSRYGTTNNAGTIPISANLYNSRLSMPISKEVNLTILMPF